MKKKIVLGIISLLTCLQIGFVFAADEISIKMDGEYIYCDQPPIIVNDTTLIPLRTISEGMGYEVNWNQEKQMILITDNGKGGGATMSMIIGKTELETGGGIKQLPVAPVIINDRTMVPIRVIAEVLLCTVDWDENTRTVDIHSTYKPNPNDIIY